MAIEKLSTKEKQEYTDNRTEQWTPNGKDYNDLVNKTSEIIDNLGADAVDLTMVEGDLAALAALSAENIAAKAVVAAGSNQGNAATIAFSGVSLISGADGTKGVKLPVLEAGHVYYLVNQSTTSSVKVYPITGGNFLGVAANGSVTLSANSVLMVIDYDGTQWAYVEYGKPTTKIYRAIVSQSGTAAPTATVLENTLGGTVVWSRASAGIYRAILNGAFLEAKTFLPQHVVSPGAGIQVSRSSDDEIDVASYSDAGTTLADDRLLSQPIEFIVYP